MITRLSFALLIVVSMIIALAKVQDSITPASATVARPYFLQEYKEISVVPYPDPPDFFKSLRARDKSILWRVHLALQLVKRPELNRRQVRIILDSVSLSTPEFFAASNDAFAKSKADNALQLLTRRALSAFPNTQAAELFTNIGSAKAEENLLKMYYDVAALPSQKTKAFFGNASSDDKSVLWRTHLALFLAKRPELKESQKDIIIAAMSLATPEYFEIRSTDSSRKTKARDPLRSLEERIAAAFSLADAAKIFATLGDDTESTTYSANYADSLLLDSINYKPLSDSGPYKQRIHSRFADQDKDKDKERRACECSTESDWCPISKVCEGTNCNRTQSGCGTLWMYPCDGVSCK